MTRRRAQAWVFRKQVKSAFDVVSSIPEPFSRRCVQGNVKVYPPFVACLARMFRCMIQGKIEILVPGYDFVIFCDHDLVKINVFLEIGELLEVVLAGFCGESRT